MKKTIEVPGMLLPEIDDVTRREFLIGSAGLLLLPAACGGNGEGEGSASGETRTIEHAFGTTEVPVDAGRIISLTGEVTDTLIALGRKPVGAVTGDPRFSPALSGEAEGVASVGENYEPNLESIAAAGPDLIVGRPSGIEPVYEQLSEIAPTIVIPDKLDFKAWLRFLGDALGEEERADEVLADYRERTDNLTERLDGIPVSLVRPNPDAFLLYGPPSAPGRVLGDLGLEMQPMPEDAEDLLGDGSVTSLSYEFVPEISGEHIFVITYDMEEAFEDLIRRPLWRRLSAVRGGRIHPVEGHDWTNHGPIGVNYMIDEVEAALTPEGGS